MAIPKWREKVVCYATTRHTPTFFEVYMRKQIKERNLKRREEERLKSAAEETALLLHRRAEGL